MDMAGDLLRRLDALTHDAPGAGAVVLRGGRIAARAVSGVRIAGRPDPVRLGDAWHVGSCTKAMTATLLARLQAQGRVDLGAGLAEALPGIAMHPAFAAMPLRAVLRHEAGIRRDPHWSVFARLRATRAPLVEQRRYIAALALADRPVAEAGYSNLGYILLGAVIEAAMGMPWERALEREVFIPLGMSGAGFGAPSLPAPVGHVAGRRGWHPKPPGPWADNPRLYGPAGRVHLPLADWAQFAAVHLGGGPSGYLSSALMREAHRPGRNGYAAGWGVGSLPDGTPLLRHTGTNTMWFADIRLLPTKGIGVMVVCNAFSAMLRTQVLSVTDDMLAASQTGPDALALRRH